MFNARFLLLRILQSKTTLGFVSFYILERRIETFYEKGHRKQSTCVIADGLGAAFLKHDISKHLVYIFRGLLFAALLLVSISKLYKIAHT